MRCSFSRLQFASIEVFVFSVAVRERFVVQAWDLHGWSVDVFFAALLFIVNSAQDFHPEHEREMCSVHEFVERPESPFVFLRCCRSVFAAPKDERKEWSDGGHAYGSCRVLATLTACEFSKKLFKMPTKVLFFACLLTKQRPFQSFKVLYGKLCP